MCFSLHPLSPACVCAGPTFRRLYGIAGGPLSQSLIYSGPFEIIELTHLSDGERRNAKRSPGEVPAAPTPNLSCLQIAQSLHHNRWDSCLSFFALLAHTLTRARWSVHAIVASAHHTFPHTYTEVQSHQTLVTTRWANRQRHVLYTSVDTHMYSLPLSLSLLLSPAHSVGYSFSPGLISMYKVSISCLQGTSLPHTQSTTKGQSQSN